MQSNITLSWVSAVTGKTIVHLPNWLGDMVMATPFLQSLKHAAEGELWGLGKSNAMHLFNGLDLFDRFIPWDSKDALKFLDLVKLLKTHNFDRAIPLPHSFRSALLFFLAGIEERTGYARNHRGFMLTHSVQEKGAIEPTVEHYLKIADFLGGRRLCDAPVLSVTTDEETHFFEHFPDVIGPFVAFIPGAQYGPSKRWPTGHFARLADLVVKQYGLTVLLLPGKGEERLAEEIRSKTTKQEAVLILSMGIRDLKVCLSKASAVITNDTGPRHIAAALKVPTVVLIGPMDDIYTKYPNPFVHQLSKDVPCKPCNRKTCQSGHECLNAIAPEEVAETMGPILAQ
jgi:heptosyltransferase II